MIDLHCHILPDMDDGAADIEESLEMAKLAQADGIHTIVASPHTLNGVYNNFASEIKTKVQRLQEILQHNNLDLKVLPACEAHLNPDMNALVDSGHAMTINNNGRYLLVEFSAQTLPPGFKDELFQIRRNGITPIIVHPERNGVLQRHWELLEEIVGIGCLLQVTAVSITGEMGRMAQECAHNLLKTRLASIIASDSHGPDFRAPVLSKALAVAIRIMGNQQEAEQMVTTTPAAIIAGQAVKVPEPLPLPAKKGFFRLW